MNKYTHQFCVNKTHMYKIIHISNQCLHLVFNVSLLVLKQPFNRLGGNERAELARGDAEEMNVQNFKFSFNYNYTDSYLLLRANISFSMKKTQYTNDQQ